MCTKRKTKSVLTSGLLVSFTFKGSVLSPYQTYFLHQNTRNDWITVQINLDYLQDYLIQQVYFIV